MTKGLSAMEMRRMRLQEITETLRQAKAKDVIIDSDKFAFEIQMKYGLTEAKANEYIKTANKVIEYESS